MYNSIDLENINTLQWTQFAATNGFHYESVWNPIDSGDKSNHSCWMILAEVVSDIEDPEVELADEEYNVTQSTH